MYILYVFLQEFAPLIDFWVFPFLVYMINNKWSWFIILIIIAVLFVATVLFIAESEKEAIENLSMATPLLAVFGLPTAYQWLTSGYYSWVVAMVGSLAVCGYFYFDHARYYGLESNWVTFAPVLDAFGIPTVYSFVTNGLLHYAISLAIGLAIYSLLFLYAHKNDLLVELIALAIIAVPIIGLILNPSLTVKIVTWVVVALLLVCYGVIYPKDVVKGAGGGGGGSSDYTPSSSFSFPSQIMRGNETFDLVENLGSIGRYKSRETGQYRDFSDYELRPNTTTRSIDD